MGSTGCCWSTTKHPYSKNLGYWFVKLLVFLLHQKAKILITVTTKNNRNTCLIYHFEIVKIKDDKLKLSQVCYQVLSYTLFSHKKYSVLLQSTLYHPLSVTKILQSSLSSWGSAPCQSDSALSLTGILPVSSPRQYQIFPVPSLAPKYKFFDQSKRSTLNL